eukprot:364502-Chlamydomonas_euryale.AAC.14
MRRSRDVCGACVSGGRRAHVYAPTQRDNPAIHMPGAVPAGPADVGLARQKEQARSDGSPLRASAAMVRQLLAPAPWRSKAAPLGAAARTRSATWPERGAGERTRGASHKSSLTQQQTQHSPARPAGLPPGLSP